MPEIIRFAWGTSTLGDFMVAVSDKGLIAADLSSYHDETEEALRARFPDADVVNKQHELTTIIEKVRRAIEEPGVDPAVSLDLRGTPYEIGVWSMLRAIPMGETTNYGALAAKLGTRDAREVTEAIARNPIAVQRETRPGSWMERENLTGDGKGKGASSSHREAESTDAPERGGLPRSSDEGPVMGLEQLKARDRP